MSERGDFLRSRTEQIWTLIFVVVVAVAVVARLFQLGYNFDSDEIFSLQLVSDNWWDVIARSLADKPHPPLHNLLLHAWIKLWGVSEIKLRLLSVLLSLGGIAISLTVLRTRVGMFGTLAAGLTLAISGFFVYYGQQSRPYALIFLAGAFNIWAFLRILGDPKKPRSILPWAASAALLVWSHYIGAIYLVVEGCLIFLRFPLRIAIRALLPCIVAGATILPWMWTAFHKSWDLHELVWNSPPDPRDIPDLYLGAVGWPSIISGWLLLGVVAVLILAGGARKIRSSSFPWDELALAAIAVLPTLAVFALSHLASTSIWAPRQLITSALAFILLLFILVDTFPRGWRALVECVIVIWAVAGSADGYQANRVPPWRNIVRRIERADPRATILVNTPWALKPLRYYTRDTAMRIIDLRGKHPDLPDGSYYGVCRHKPIVDPCEQLVEQSRGPHRGAIFAQDPWNTAGGNARDLILTYRIVRGN